jgi:hypothetical protein
MDLRMPYGSLSFMDRIPDNLPVTGYTTANNNSIIDWCNQPGGLREKL